MIPDDHFQLSLYYSIPSFLQGVQSSSVAVAAYGIEKKMEGRWGEVSSRKKHDSMSDAEEGETWDEVCSLFMCIHVYCVAAMLLLVMLLHGCINGGLA